MKNFKKFRDLIKKDMLIELKTECMSIKPKDSYIGRVHCKKCEEAFCVRIKDIKGGSGCNGTWIVTVGNFLEGKLSGNVNCDKIIVL